MPKKKWTRLESFPRRFCLLLFPLSVGFVLFGLAYGGGDKFVIAQVHYSGGGDWYGDRTSISNWLKLLRRRTDVETADDRVIVKLTDRELYQYPMLYIVGHGEIRLSEKESRGAAVLSDSRRFPVCK